MDFVSYYALSLAATASALIVIGCASLSLWCYMRRQNRHRALDFPEPIIVQVAA